MMSEERMAEEAIIARRIRRVRPPPQIRPVRGGLLANVLMAALAVYAGGRAVHGPAEAAPPVREGGAAQLSQAPAVREPEPTQPEKTFSNQELERLVSDVLDGIVTADMTRMEQARAVVYDAVEKCLDRNITDWGKMKNVMKDALGDYIRKKTKRNPMILPIIMEV